jgi:hypothetical protein
VSPFDGIVHSGAWPYVSGAYGLTFLVLTGYFVRLFTAWRRG